MGYFPEIDTRPKFSKPDPMPVHPSDAARLAVQFAVITAAVCFGGILAIMACVLGLPFIPWLFF